MGLRCSQQMETNYVESTDVSMDHKNEDGVETTYNAWLIKHPSALNKFDQMMAKVNDKRLVVFLDYDGTLSQIVDDPDQAFISDSMRSALDKVAQNFPTCIISGRRRDKVFEFVKLNNVYYVGSHGMDILAPSKLSMTVNPSFQERVTDKEEHEIIAFQPAQDFLPTIKQVFKELEEKTSDIRGVMIEDNKFCVTVHFRRVDKKNWEELEKLVISISKNYPSLRITKGRKVIEMRPSIKWDKGRALEYLLDTSGLGSCTDALPLYIGDDLTDEDAFQVLINRDQGFPIVVSSIPKETKASYSLRNPAEVMSFILKLSEWKKNPL